MGFVLRVDVNVGHGTHAWVHVELDPSVWSLKGSEETVWVDGVCSVIGNHHLPRFYDGYQH